MQRWDGSIQQAQLLILPINRLSLLRKLGNDLMDKFRAFDHIRKTTLHAVQTRNHIPRRIVYTDALQAGRQRIA